LRAAASIAPPGRGSHTAAARRAAIRGTSIMQSTNRILDDLARVASGAIGTFGGLRQEVEGRLREQVERILASMAVVSREEFEAAKAVAAAAGLNQEALERRVAALEARIGNPGRDNA